MTKERMAQLNVRVPQRLKRVMERFVSLDAHTNISDLARDAIREKIVKEAPELYASLFREDQK